MTDEKEESLKRATARLDFCIERVLQIPEVTKIVLQGLIDKYGAELTCDIEELTHEEQVRSIREIIAASEAKEPSPC